MKVTKTYRGRVGADHDGTCLNPTAYKNCCAGCWDQTLSKNFLFEVFILRYLPSVGFKAIFPMIVFSSAYVSLRLLIFKTSSRVIVTNTSAIPIIFYSFADITSTIL